MSDDKTTALVIGPTNMGELQKFAHDAAATGFFGVSSPQQALILAMTGRDLGLSYTQALRAFHVVKGRPVMSADGMVAVCLARRDLCEYFITVEATSDRCTVETKRAGTPRPQSFTYTMDDAKRAGLAGKDTWKSHPAAMLKARAKSALARDVYPDLLMGMYDPDEIEQVPAGEPVALQHEPERREAPFDADAFLADFGIERPDVEAYYRHLGKTFPADGPTQEKHLSVLVSPSRRQKFDDWLAEHREREAIREEPIEPEYEAPDADQAAK